MAAPSGGGGRTDGSAKSIVADQISQSVQSTSNLIHLMRQSSPSHAQLMKLPRNLLAKTSTIKNTEMVSVDSTVCIFPQGEIKQYFVQWSMCRPFGVGYLLSALGLDGYEEVSQVKLKVAAADGAVSLSLWSIAD